MTWKDTLNLPVSAQGEWAAKRFYGDPKLAAAYLPLAYTLLGEVKNRMAYGGVSYGHRMIELPDGTRIRVIRNGEQNILEIETVPVVEEESLSVRYFGYTFYPKRSGYPSGFIRPITEDEPYGTRADFPWTLIETDGYISQIRLQYERKEDQPIIKIARCTEMLSGNQFAFNEFDVYSWWGSPCGDGPFAVYRLPIEIPFVYYRPFLFGGVIPCYLYPGCQIEPIPPILPTYLTRNGILFGDYQAWIAGMGFTTIEIDDVEVRRGVLAFYAGTSISVAMIDLGASEIIGAPVVAFTPEDVSDSNKLLLEQAWPWRFNDDCTEVSGIVREKEIRPIAVGSVDIALLIVTVSLSYSVGGVGVGAVSIERYERPITRTDTTVIETTSNDPDVNYPIPPRTNGPYKDSPGGRTIVHRLEAHDRYGKRVITQEFEGGFDVPFALDYVDNQLKKLTFSAEIDSTETGDEFGGGQGAFFMSIHDQWVRIDGNVHGNYQIDIKINSLPGSDMWIGNKYDGDSSSLSAYQSSLFGISEKSTGEGEVRYEESSRLYDTFDYTADIVGGWGPRESIEETWEFSVNRKYTRSYTVKSESRTERLSIAYINLKANAEAHFVNSYTRSFDGEIDPQIENAPFEYSKPHPSTNPYNGGTVYNIDLTRRPRVISEANDSVNETGSDLDMNFVAYGKKEQGFQDASTNTEQGPMPNFVTVGLFKFPYGQPDVHEVVVTESIAEDPTNRWARVYNSSFSIAADHTRPVILEKPPSYIAEIGVPGYFKQTSTFGDPKDFIEDNPSLYPIGLF